MIVKGIAKFYGTKRNHIVTTQTVSFLSICEICTHAVVQKLNIVAYIIGTQMCTGLLPMAIGARVRSDLLAGIGERARLIGRSPRSPPSRDLPRIRYGRQ